MIQTEELNKIQHYLQEEGITHIPLRDDLIDHYACTIEEKMRFGKLNFKNAFIASKLQINPDGPYQIQKDLTYFLTIKNSVMIRKVVFILSYISVFQIITGYSLALAGFIPYDLSGMMMFGGLSLLSITAVPYFFYMMYQRSLNQLKST